jgi:hypothetical protein
LPEFPQEDLPVRQRGDERSNQVAQPSKKDRVIEETIGVVVEDRLTSPQAGRCLSSLSPVFAIAAYASGILGN